MDELKLEGIIPAIVTPMDETFQIAQDDLRRYVEWLTGFRIGGLAVNVDTGEGPALSSDERRDVLRTVSLVVKNRIPIIAGVPPSSTDAAVGSALDAREAGADALLVFPHPAFCGQPLPPEPPYLYHKAIAEATGLPIVIFELQAALGGYQLSDDVIHRLLEIPNVVAIKDASFDAQLYAHRLRILRNAKRKITMLTGNDSFIAESLILGAQGALVGFGTLATDKQVEMHTLVAQKKFAEAMEVWEKLLPLVDVIFKSPLRDYRARTKIALAIQGIIENAYVRPPLTQLAPDEISKLGMALIDVGIAREKEPFELSGKSLDSRTRCHKT